MASQISGSIHLHIYVYVLSILYNASYLHYLISWLNMDAYNNYLTIYLILVLCNICTEITNLKYIKLIDSPLLSREALETFFQSRSLINLFHINLSECPNVSDEALINMSKICSKLEVIAL